MLNKVIRFFIGVVSLFILFLIIMIFFNRAPSREVPQGQVVVSPANGRLVAIQKIESEELFF